MSQAKTKPIADDLTPVTGGVKTPARLLRSGFDRDISGKVSPLDKHVLRLLTLHKDMSVRFRSVDLATMNDTSKRALLTEIQGLLKIGPVGFPPHGRNEHGTHDRRKRITENSKGRNSLR